VADVEGFVLETWEVRYRANGEGYLYIVGHYESCMWCSTVIRPGQTHCPSCAARTDTWTAG
jgi:uncharacterized OB-fold protein